MIRTAAALFSAALLLSASTLAQAQVQIPPDRSAGIGSMEGITRNGQQTTIFVGNPISECPVSMQARQRGMGAMVQTQRKLFQDPPQTMHGPAQHIHLILTGFAKDKRVASATVTARGLSARSRMQTLSLTGQDQSDIRRTLQVTFTPDPDGSVSADIDLPAFTAVNSLQLKSIRYSDGSSWTVEKANACIVQPDPFMLVAGN